MCDINASKTYLADECDVVVVGAGHAGCEAALASARLGFKTVVFAINLDSIAMMPCNPSIGGSSKGHLVREIDALGGEMGKNIDKTYLQIKMLNTSKGPAVYSLRAQADKNRYKEERTGARARLVAAGARRDARGIQMEARGHLRDGGGVGKILRRDKGAHTGARGL